MCTETAHAPNHPFEFMLGFIGCHQVIKKLLAFSNDLLMIQNELFVMNGHVQLKYLNDKNSFLFIGCNNLITQQSSDTAISSKEIPHLR